MWKNLIFVIAFVWVPYAYSGPLDPIVSMVWVGETVPEQTAVTLQLNLTTIKAVKLVSVSSPFVESIEIHSLINHKGVMKVRSVQSLSFPAHGTTTFGSKNLFLMMSGIKKPLKIGEPMPVNLTFVFADNRSKTISIDAEVRKVELSYKHYGPNKVYDHR